MFETYQMLGEQRQADFEREAERFRHAARLPKRRRRIRMPWTPRRTAAAPQVAASGTRPLVDSPTRAA